MNPNVHWAPGMEYGLPLRQQHDVDLLTADCARLLGTVGRTPAGGLGVQEAVRPPQPLLPPNPKQHTEEGPRAQEGRRGSSGGRGSGGRAPGEAHLRHCLLAPGPQRPTALPSPSGLQMGTRAPHACVRVCRGACWEQRVRVAGLAAGPGSFDGYVWRWQLTACKFPG